MDKLKIANEIKVSRDNDRLIAKQQGSETYIHPLEGKWIETSSVKAHRVGDANGRILPKYTLSLDAAWELILDLKEKGLTAKLYIDKGESRVAVEFGEDWQVVYGQQSIYEPALAICEAWWRCEAFLEGRELPFVATVTGDD